MYSGWLQGEHARWLRARRMASDVIELEDDDDDDDHFGSRWTRGVKAAVAHSRDAFINHHHEADDVVV